MHGLGERMHGAIHVHAGDMDFKVAGDQETITAFQMDIKVRSEVVMVPGCSHKLPVYTSSLSSVECYFTIAPSASLRDPCISEPSTPICCTWPGGIAIMVNWCTSEPFTLICCARWRVSPLTS